MLGWGGAGVVSVDPYSDLVREVALALFEAQRGKVPHLKPLSK